MKNIMIGIGEIGATANPGEQLKTMALGSCVALILLDPGTHCVGMDHIALPESSASADKAKVLPGYFADTGVKALLDEMSKKGAGKDRRKYIVKLTGGANVMDTNNTFNIGKRNVLAIKKTLWQYGMGPRAEDVGGNISRTVSVDVNGGKVKITSPGRDEWEI